MIFDQKNYILQFNLHPLEGEFPIQFFAYKAPKASETHHFLRFKAHLSIMAPDVKIPRLLWVLGIPNRSKLYPEE